MKLCLCVFPHLLSSKLFTPLSHHSSHLQIQQPCQAELVLRVELGQNMSQDKTEVELGQNMSQDKTQVPKGELIESGRDLSACG